MQGCLQGCAGQSELIGEKELHVYTGLDAGEKLCV